MSSSSVPSLRGLLLPEATVDDPVTGTEFAAIMLEPAFVVQGGPLRYLHIVDELSVALTSSIMLASAYRTDFRKRMRKARQQFGDDVIHPSIRALGEETAPVIHVNDNKVPPFWSHFDMLDGQESVLYRLATPLFMAIAGVGTETNAVPTYAHAIWKDWWNAPVNTIKSELTEASRHAPNVAAWPCLFGAVRPIIRSKAGMSPFEQRRINLLCHRLFIGAAIARGPSLLEGELSAIYDVDLVAPDDSFVARLGLKRSPATWGFLYIRSPWFSLKWTIGIMHRHQQSDNVALALISRRGYTDLDRGWIHVSSNLLLLASPTIEERRRNIDTAWDVFDAFLLLQSVSLEFPSRRWVDWLTRGPEIGGLRYTDQPIAYPWPYNPVLVEQADERVAAMMARIAIKAPNLVIEVKFGEVGGCHLPSVYHWVATRMQTAGTYPNSVKAMQMLIDIVTHQDEDAVVSFITRNRDNDLPCRLFPPGFSGTLFQLTNATTPLPLRVICALLMRPTYIGNGAIGEEWHGSQWIAVATLVAVWYVRVKRSHVTSMALLGLWSERVVAGGWYTHVDQRAFLNLMRVSWSRARPLLAAIIREAAETQAKYDYLNDFAAVVRTARFGRISGFADEQEDEDFDAGKALSLLDTLDAALVALGKKGFT